MLYSNQPKDIERVGDVEEMTDFGCKLKNMRMEMGLTPDELAEALDMTKTLIWSFEINKKEPTYSHLIRIADYFHVSVDYLMNRKPVYIDLEDSMDEILGQYNLAIDGEPLTKEEVMDGVAYLKAKRTLSH